jgi:ABC-type uncharacterized transport system substrate-binding protein
MVGSVLGSGKKPMRRREFISLLGGGAVAWPLVTRAEQSKIARIGALYIGTADAESFKKELREGLRELGYVEGQNIAFEFRSAEGQLDRLPGLAAELVRLKVDVIVTLYIPPSLATKQATRDIPIVVIVGDPVETGIVSSLARPGGNITGVSIMAAASNGKSVELFRDMLPSARRVGVMGHATNPVFAKAMLDEVLRYGGPTGTEIHPVVMVRGPDDLENAFATLVRERADALVVQGSLAIKPVTDMALKYRLPAVLHRARVCGYRRPDVIRGGWTCLFSARRQVCAEDFAGRAAKRHTHRATHEVRAGHKSQDCEGHRPHDSGNVFAAGRRSARMKR